MEKHLRRFFPPKDPELEREYEHQLALVQKRFGYTREERDQLWDGSRFDELERRSMSLVYMCGALEYSARKGLTVTEHLRLIRDVQMMLGNFGIHGYFPDTSTKPYFTPKSGD